MHKLKTDRMLILFDSIIAISLTLLLIDLLPPSLYKLADAHLFSIIKTLLPHFLSYAICFFVCLLFWFMHHIIYHDIRKITYPLLYLNLVWLLMVTLLPVFTMLMYRSENVSFTIVFHLLLFVVVCLTYALWYFSIVFKEDEDPVAAARTHAFFTTSLVTVGVVVLIVMLFVYYYGFPGLFAWFFYPFLVMMLRRVYVESA